MASPGDGVKPIYSRHRAMPSGRLSAALEVLAVATRLGLTPSCGGPVAHLGYFRNEYVVRRRWLDEPTYADVVALCQFLPGPASSQVGIAVGILRAGLPGGLAAWLGFTLPSALALVLFALFIRGADLSGAGWLLGLKIAAVAVVAQAVWGMARALCPDRERASIAIAAALVVTAWPGAWGGAPAGGGRRRRDARARADGPAARGRGPDPVLRAAAGPADPALHDR